MAGFEEIVTPVHAAVDRSNDALASDINDLVEAEVETGPAETLDMSEAKEMVPGQASASEKKDEKAETPEEAAERRFKAMEREEAIKLEMEQILRKTRAERFRARPNAKSLAHAFLMEIIGIDRFKQDYTLAGKAIQLVFHTPTEDQVREIGKQMVRDTEAKRALYMHETTLDAVCYRVAMALASITIVNPMTNEIVKCYRQDEVPATSLDGAFLDCLPTDLEPRKRWKYLTKHVLKTQYLTNQVQSTYDEFELLLAELVLMSNEDPDFFSTES